MQVPVGLIQFGLTSLGPWMTPFALLLESYTAAMNVVCANDPPPMPDFSSFNPLDLVGGVFNPAFEPARLQLRDAFENWLWHRFCFCSTGAEAQPPATFIPPPLSTGPSSSSNSTPCFSGGWSGLVPPLSGGDFQIGQSTDVTPLILPLGRGRQQIVSEGIPFTAYQIPTGPTLVRGTGQNPTPLETLFGPIASVDLWTFDVNALQVRHLGFQSPQFTQTFDVNFTLLSTEVFWYAGAYNRIIFGEPPASGPVQLATSIYCGETDRLAVQSCCPPDASLSNMLQAILNSIANIPSGGGLPPGSYVDSVNHAGLAGLGRIPIQHDTVACRVVITTDNNQLPVGTGDPPYLFNRGFIVPIVSGGAVRGNVRLTYNPQLYVLPQLTEEIGYTLTETLVASIIEMVPGP